MRKLEQRFALTNVQDDERKIQLCSMYIGQTDEDILGGLPEDTTWDEAKLALSNRLAGGSNSDESYHLLKNITRDGRDLVDLASEIEKLAR